MKHKIVFFLALFGIILYTYWGLWNTFFAQDEWVSMGLAVSGGVFAGIKDVTLIELASGKMRVFGTLLNNIIHLYFPFNIVVFSIFALVIHWFNSLLVYFFALKITKHPLAAAIAAVYFSVAAVSSGTVLWISAHTTALLNATFVLISLIYYMDPRRWRLSFIAAIIAYLFKESSIFLFILLPLMAVIFSKKKRSHVPLFMYLGFIIVVRAMSLMGTEGQQGVFVTQQTNALERIGVHAIFYPLVAFSQMYIPQELMAKLTHQITVSDMISVVSSILLIVCFLFWAYKNVTDRKVIIFSLLYCVLSFLPFIVLDRPMSSYLESRYYYLGVIGAAILLGALVVRMRLRQAALVFIFLFVGMIIYKNSTYVRREVRRQVIIADERKRFLAGVKEMYPTLPDHPIIYITGDSPGFYGIGDLSVPFQQGMGYTMMVWYFGTGKIPRELLGEMYLWNINSQGYKETKGKAFGYFWDESQLLEEVNINPDINPNQIIALQYIASQKKLIDRTNETRELLSRRFR